MDPLAAPSDVWQHIAIFLDRPADVRAYLEALPPRLLSPPLASLLALMAAQRAGRLAATAGDVRLWPTLDLSNASVDDDLAHHIATCLGLFPMLRLQVVGFPYAMPRTTRLELTNLSSPTAFMTALQQWPDAITSLSLDLRDGAWSIEALAHGLASLPRLEAIDVFWPSTRSDEAFATLLQAITATPITSLALRFSFDSRLNWTASLTALLEPWLTTRPVRSMAVHDLKAIDEACVLALLDAIARCETLETLVLRSVVLARSLFKRRLAFPKSLTTLELWSIPCVDLDRAMASLAHLALHTLRFSVLFPGQHKRDEDLAATRFISETLPTLTSLRTLELFSFPLPRESWRPLSLVLQRLQQVYLYENKLKDDGVSVLAAALPACHHLQTLHLISQKCTDRSAIAIANGAPTSLRALDLSENRIGSDGAIALSRLLGQLDAIDLNDNGIGADGAARHLRQVGLMYTSIKRRGVLALVSGLSHSPFFQGGAVVVIGTVGRDRPNDVAACRQAIARLPNQSMLQFEEPDAMF
ncbi:hypothetical protein SPRG_13627 [Saprolegnia parasitica CBS 223.65]|uniref:F-box domain-containing protein n=1 Tax=Saprolegnia parasitica (strain CBS 223.65) TaxID=695850 RepID=A0A067C2N9_SAPPC|nr:hypothetical protein SPRG_13627 [Saprolegnia parasitica CBS 223.65]KDO20811.1 hypothetical protein SPRG_13627 [Saprolegnia parasitica CBS 223.65]|eukprot:XP_012208470.1 hypothetical protein SPRG_13627 [Saprolegnia parasitica CBS 223.65]